MRTRMPEARYRVGEHYGIHVYEGDRPVATFFNPEEAALFVAAVNAAMSDDELRTKPDDEDEGA
jgi:hypothetical protein